MTDPKLPLYLPDPFARAAWHMKHMHPLTRTETVAFEATIIAGSEVTVGFPDALSCTDSQGNTYVSHDNGSFTSMLARGITAGSDSRTFIVAAHPRHAFWHELADWIAGQGGQLAAAGGRWGMCDEPGACHKAEDIAQRYLAALTEAELAQIPPDVHS